MIWRAWSFVTESKLNKRLAVLLAFSLITACKQNGISNTSINDVQKNYENRIDRYLKENDIKSLIKNKILKTPNEIIYNGGTLFYPNGTGVIFSEGSINMRYSVVGENLCIISSHSNCFKIMKQNGSYYKININNKNVYAERLEIQTFIR